MACFTEFASTLLGVAYRKPKTFNLLSNNTRIRKTTLLHRSNSSSVSKLLCNNIHTRQVRRFAVASSSTASPPQTDEDEEVSTVIPPDNRIPATIITGFLGSGKVSYLILFPLIFISVYEIEIWFWLGIEQTTLLNHILTAEHGKRIAVIENEVCCVVESLLCVCSYMNWNLNLNMYMIMTYVVPTHVRRHWPMWLIIIGIDVLVAVSCLCWLWFIIYDYDYYYDYNYGFLYQF